MCLWFLFVPASLASKYCLSAVWYQARNAVFRAVSLKTALTEVRMNTEDAEKMTKQWDETQQSKGSCRPGNHPFESLLPLPHWCTINVSKMPQIVCKVPTGVDLNMSTYVRMLVY